eukprot:TRINITY_DN20230_c0_g3_i2.p2 TRINITY_DN20230_c0_g3~~TRINITY_DN20230_c0_g3_i2.p2  ORF type:complete len:233 (-),score=-11.39 TRINITY_DN20230_c0_g3_i2:178-876(-)
MLALVHVYIFILNIMFEKQLVLLRILCYFELICFLLFMFISLLLNRILLQNLIYFKQLYFIISFSNREFVLYMCNSILLVPQIVSFTCNVLYVHAFKTVYLINRVVFGRGGGNISSRSIKFCKVSNKFFIFLFATLSNKKRQFLINGLLKYRVFYVKQVLLFQLFQYFSLCGAPPAHSWFIVQSLNLINREQKNIFQSIFRVILKGTVNLEINLNLSWWGPNYQRKMSYILF